MWRLASHSSLHLQSFQQASAKPDRNFRKPTGVPPGFFCHRVSTNSSTYHPTQTCCFYNHPESTRLCQNPKKCLSRISEGGKKSSMSPLLWFKWSLLEHQVSTRCFPEPLIYLLVFWKPSKNSTWKTWVKNNPLHQSTHRIWKHLMKVNKKDT